MIFQYSGRFRPQRRETARHRADNAAPGRGVVAAMGLERFPFTQKTLKLCFGEQFHPVTLNLPVQLKRILL
jgi:hypothetical protein